MFDWTRYSILLGIAALIATAFSYRVDGSHRLRFWVRSNAHIETDAALIKIIECPRDAWQGLPLHIPAEVKADYLRVLIAAGFRHIDAVSFVLQPLCHR